MKRSAGGCSRTRGPARRSRSARRSPRRPGAPVLRGARRRSRSSRCGGTSSRGTTTSITGATTSRSAAGASSCGREVDFELFGATSRIGVRGVFDYGTEAEHRQRELRGQLHLARGLRGPLLRALDAGRLRRCGPGAFGMPLAASEMLWDRRHPDSRRSRSPGYDARRDVEPDLLRRRLLRPAALPRRVASSASARCCGRPGSRAASPSRPRLRFWYLDLRNARPAVLSGENTRRRRRTASSLTSRSSSVARPARRRSGSRSPGCPSPSASTASTTSGRKTRAPGPSRPPCRWDPVGTPRTWRGFFAYQYIERDALDGRLQHGRLVVAHVGRGPPVRPRLHRPAHACTSSRPSSSSAGSTTTTGSTG